MRRWTLDRNDLAFHVSASAGQVEHAWSIGFERYAVAGRMAYANTRAPLLPGAAAGVIQGVIGLSTTYIPHHQVLYSSPSRTSPSTTPHIVTGGPQPCSAAKTAGAEYGSYTADQLAAAYSFSSLYGASDLGAGQTVGLFELEPNKATDISAYQSCYGTSAAVTYTKADGGAGTGAGGGEAALDIEDVIGLAPKANVDVYQGPNTNAGLYATYSAIVNDDQAKVVSTSWGDCESASTAVMSEESTLFQQAATQGQSVFAAAGDNGSEDCGKVLSVDDPASQPYVTGVGGTTLTAIGPPPTEVVWNEKSLGGGAGGGGISSDWTMPSYQSGAPAALHVVNSNSSGTPCGAASGSYCREVPDVSADADPYSGYVIYYDGSWTGIGGTSAASPLWAAFMALTNASSACDGANVGFANPVLYDAAASDYAASFSDITSGNNDYKGDNGGKFPAGAGYDMASGLGTPIGSALPESLCRGGSSNTVTVTNPGTQKTVLGHSASLQIQATDSGGLGLTFSATGLPPGLSISSSGRVSGTPTASGQKKVTVTASDSTGASGNATFIWKVPKT